MDVGDSHSFHGGKRARLDDNAHVLTTSEFTFQSNVDAMTNLWRSEYDRKSHEKMVLDISHKELQTKYANLGSGHTHLQQAYHDLLVLFNSQNEHISQLPNQSEVTRLQETIEVMENENQRNLDKIFDVESQRDAYEAIINDFAMKEEDTRAAFEKEKKALKNMFEQQMKDLKKNHEKETSRLRQSIDAMDTKQKNHAEMLSIQEKIAFEATNIDVQAKQEAGRDVRQKENKTLILRDKMLSWKEYEKRVSNGSIKSIQLVRVRIHKSIGSVASLEDILEKLPNIQLFWFVADRVGFISSTTKATFTKLLRLQSFKDLQKFYLSGITLDKFDADSFIDFTKNHPSCQFILSFHLTKKKEFNAIAQKLRKACPSTNKLVIDLLQPNNSVIHR